METFSRPIGEHQASCDISPASPGINQHGPLGRLTPHPAKKKKKNRISKELKTNSQQRGKGAVSAPETGGEARS
jgi:hypothetical protein